MKTITRATIIIMLFVGFLVAQPVFAADVAKIGIVDFQKILATSEKGKVAQARINKEGKRMETELKKLGQQLEALKAKLEREALVMSRDKRDEKNREMRIKYNDFKTMQKKYTTDFKAMEKQLVSKIQKDVVGILSGIGKKQGFLLILEAREAGVLYAPKALNITDQVIQSYNKMK